MAACRAAASGSGSAAAARASGARSRRGGTGHGSLRAAAEAACLGGLVLRAVLERRGQLARELSGRRGAILRILGHPALQDLGGRLRGARPRVEEVGSALGGDPVRDLQRRAALARALPAQRLERDRRERVHVGGGPSPAAVQLFGRHVRSGAQHGAAAGDLGAVGGGGDPEVRELRDPIPADQHVARLHVAVDHALGVRVVERVSEVANHARDLLRPQRPAAEHPRQRLAVHELHDDQDALVVGRGVEHRDEVRVVQRGAQLGLARKAPFDVHRAVGMQPLDRYLAGKPLVLTQENRGHAARPEVPDHPVAAVQK